MSKENEFRLTVTDDKEAAYLYLPDLKKDNKKMSKTLRLIELLPGYKGADVNFDFDEDGVLVGIEVLVLD